MIQRIKKINLGTKILISIIIMTVFGITINSYGVVSQMKSLVKQNSNELLNMLADSVFITLRDAMNTGDTEKIREAENDSRNKINGLEKLKIAKSKSIIKRYGSKQPFTKDKDILNVFKTKQNFLIDSVKNKKHTIRVLKPMIATQECLKCHTNEKADSVIAVIDLTFNLDKSDSLISKALENLTIIVIILLMIALPMIYIVINKGIITPIDNFQEGLLDFFKYLNREKDDVKLLSYSSGDEIGDMTEIINKNIAKTKINIEKETEEKWIKEGISGLNKELSGTNDIVAVSNKAISYLCNYLKAGVGALYCFNDEKNLLHLNGSYAFIQREDLSNNFKLGEGVVGQVALEKSPIQLKNIKRTQVSIVTGTTSEPPLNTYTFPLIYQNKVFGVIEIGSTKFFDEAEQDLFERSNKIIATALSTAVQNTKVKELLSKSQKVNIKLQQQQKELESKNMQMQEQQAQLEEVNAQMQEQQAQLEESNSQMQEQQAQLEEVNAQMEEQQLQLKQSEKELKFQNAELENSKEELSVKAKALEESNRYKSEFLANMSHELRTPLNSVILLSGMLRENKKQHLSEDEIKKADIINSSGEDLLKLINNVLDLSKVEAGRMELLVEEFSSAEFINYIKDLFEPSAQNNGLEFIVKDNYNNTIIGDKDKLVQVIRNFLSNSLKFTAKGSVSLIIEPSDKNSVKLSVKDTGIGIPKDKQKLVFKAFQQADGSTSRRYGGTGLGLSITKELAKLMHGKIFLESEEGKGSTFSIVIPNLNDKNISITKEVATPKQEVQPQSQAQPKLKPQTEIFSIIDDSKEITETDKPFLIIEDNEGFALTLKNIINNKGDLVLIATTGTQGIKLAKSYNNIQGILLDLGLPDIDGVEVLKELKTNINTRKIPVYILSGRAIQDKTKLMSAVGFKQKPLSKNDLKNVFDDFVKFNDKKVKDLLIVEDNDVQREAMIEFIGNETINSKGVASIDEAISELGKDIYDAVVVDLSLKEGSGLKVCKYIKNNKINIPIVVYTGKELTQKEEKEIRKYTDSIVIKSANSQNRLLNEIDMFLHRVKTPITKMDEGTCSNHISLNGKKILVVDDDMRNTYVLMEILEEKGATVITAENGKEALEILEKNLDTNIVLMDIMMPVMDGYEAIKIIKANDNMKNIPVIAVTAKAMNEDKEKCLEVGANDFLTKPLNLDTFVCVVQAWIK